MRALVTGGAGFIGSAIAKALLDSGHSVVVLDNLSTGLESSVPSAADFVFADIRNLGSLESSFKNVDVVFHQAAFKSVPKSIENPMEAETNNSLGTLNVLMAASKAGVRRVIYASSSSVYGEGDGVKGEELPTQPISPYGVSKLTGEHYCRVWARVTPLSTVCLRYFNVFGPGQRADSQYAAVIPAFISSLQRGNPAVIHGDGHQTRDFTYIDDVVRANICAMKSVIPLNGSVMNVCAGSPKSINELHRQVSTAMAVSIPPVYVAERVGDIKHSHGDISRAQSLLTWSPQTDWSTAIQRTVDWFKASSQLDKK
jgi:nucleoside-diphosphate-sugar epimerase